MKQIGILIGTALLVALPVVGQDDANTKLKERIDALVRELKTRKAKAPKRGEFVEQRLYDVSDLVYQELPEFWNRNVPHFHDQEEEDEVDVEPICPVEMDLIIEMVRQTVHPETWDRIEGTDMAPKGRTLLVQTIPSVHRGIERCLATLRRAYSTRVSVEIIAIELDEEVQAVLDKHTGTLPEAVAAALRKRERLGSVRTFAGPGLTRSGRQGSTLDYIAGYDVKAIGAAAVGAPIRHKLFDGCQALVSAHPTPDGKHTMLDVTIERTHTSFDKSTDVSHGPIQLPRQSVVRLGGSAWLASGASTVIGGGAHGGGGCVFLVRAIVRR